MKVSYALRKHSIRFFGEISLRKGKYVVIKSSNTLIKIKFTDLLQLFFSFFKVKKLKKLAVALKLLTVLSCISDVFCSFYKSSTTRNHLKPENLETLFLLSALKMLIKSVTSHQAEIKYLEVISPLIFRFRHKVRSLFNTHIFKNMMNNYA